MFKAGRRFILQQKIEELKRAIRHWPDSPKLVDRQIELREKQEELEKLESEK